MVIKLPLSNKIENIKENIVNNINIKMDEKIYNFVEEISSQKNGISTGIRCIC